MMGTFIAAIKNNTLNTSAIMGSLSLIAAMDHIVNSESASWLDYDKDLRYETLIESRIANTTSKSV